MVDVCKSRSSVRNVFESLQTRARLIKIDGFSPILSIKLRCSDYARFQTSIPIGQKSYPIKERQMSQVFFLLFIVHTNILILDLSQ